MEIYYVGIADPMCISDPRDVSLGVVAYQKKKEESTSQACT
jgi:hypothetical protein